MTAHEKRWMYAEIGPKEYAEKILVYIHGESDVPGFFVCNNKRGLKMLVHRNKLTEVKPWEVKP